MTMPIQSLVENLSPFLTYVVPTAILPSDGDPLLSEEEEDARTVPYMIQAVYACDNFQESD